MKIQHLSVEEACANLQSGLDGLSPREAMRRLLENRIGDPAGRSHPFGGWLFALPFAVFLLGLEESRKGLVRHFLKLSTACRTHLLHEPA